MCPFGGPLHAPFADLTYKEPLKWVHAIGVFHRDHLGLDLTGLTARATNILDQRVPAASKVLTSIMSMQMYNNGMAV